jgi:hypothetical protein
MTQLFNKIFHFFKPEIPTHDKSEYDYLCRSTDLVDLERRQRKIQQGTAPWQRFAK